MIEKVSSSSFRVLIVDDSNNIHEDFRKVLARAAVPSVLDLEAEIFGDAARVEAPRVTFLLDSAFQGDDGVALAAQAVAEKRPYALAFVDMRMPPGMDGLGTIVKLWEVDPQLQIVICSAYSDYSWAEIVGRVGQNDRLLVLQKPFDNIEVLQLAHTLTAKWDLQQRLQTSLHELETRLVDQTQALRHSQVLVRLLLETASDLVTVIDGAERRVYSSPSHALLGFTPEAVQGMAPFDLFHPDDRPQIDQAIDRALQRHCDERVRCRLRHRDGRYRVFHTRIGAVCHPGGGLMHLVTVSHPESESPGGSVAPAV